MHRRSGNGGSRRSSWRGVSLGRAHHRHVLRKARQVLGEMRTEFHQLADTGHQVQLRAQGLHHGRQRDDPIQETLERTIAPAQIQPPKLGRERFGEALDLGQPLAPDGRCHRGVAALLSSGGGCRGNLGRRLGRGGTLAGNHALVDLADRIEVGLDLGLHLLVHIGLGTDPHLRGQEAQPRLVTRQFVNLSVVRQLEVMLHAPQVPIGIEQRAVFPRGEITFLPQAVEGVHRAAAPQEPILAAMESLQALD